MKLRDDRIPNDVEITPEGGAEVHVVCKRCGAQIGRLQTIPVEEDADQEEIYAEIRTIAEEHRLQAHPAPGDELDVDIHVDGGLSSPT